MKKPWYFYLIIGLSVFGVISGILLTSFFILWNVDDNQGQPRIDNIYSKFENIEFANEIYCSAKDNYGSFNHQIINIQNIYDQKSDASFIPTMYRPCDYGYFDDYIYSTKDSVYFTYEISFKSEIKYLVFKTKWEKNSHIEYVSTLDAFSGKAHNHPTLYNYDNKGSYFYIRNNQNYDLYYFNVEQTSLIYLDTVDDKPGFVSNNCQKVGTTKKEEFDLSIDNRKHRTSFAKTCHDAYEIVLSSGFKNYDIYQMNNYSLCVYRYNTSWTGSYSVLAVFSYNWEKDVEAFQGIYAVYYNGYFDFRGISIVSH